MTRKQSHYSSNTLCRQTALTIFGLIFLLLFPVFPAHSFGAGDFARPVADMSGATCGDAIEYDIVVSKKRNPVEKNSSSVFDSLQAAVDQASNSERICVQEGNYSETVRINKNITIFAPGRAVLYGSETTEHRGIIIEEQAHPEIVGLTIKDFAVGVYARNTAEAWKLKNVTICNIRGASRNGGIGVNAWSSTSDWQIKNSTFCDSKSGIMAPSSRGNWIVQGSSFINHTDDAIGTMRSTGSWSIRTSSFRNSSTSHNNPTIGAEITEGDWEIRNVTIMDSPNGVGAKKSNGNWSIQDSRFENHSIAGVSAPNSTGNWMIHDSVVRNASWGVNAADNTGNWSIRQIHITTVETGIDARRADGDWLVSSSNISDLFARWNLPWKATGVYAVRTSGDWTVLNSTFSNISQHGINATGAMHPGSAVNNWWGSDDGPKTLDCIGNVNCSPWLKDPPGRSSTISTTSPTSTTRKATSTTSEPEQIESTPQTSDGISSSPQPETSKSASGPGFELTSAISALVLLMLVYMRNGSE